jgi:DNA polymerase III delta prime subunit
MEPNTLWTEKYRPRVPDQVVGHDEVTRSVLQWFQAWVTRKNKKKEEEAEEEAVEDEKEEEEPLKAAAFLWGAPGIGKTTIIHAVCRQMGYECVEYNASDIRSASMIKKIRQKSNNQFAIDSFFVGAPKPVAILLDELDGICNGESISEVLRWVEDPDRIQPLFFTSNQPLPALRALCESHLVLPPSPAIIRSLLQDIEEKVLSESVARGGTRPSDTTTVARGGTRPSDTTTVARGGKRPDSPVARGGTRYIADVVKGDVRQAITMLQFGNEKPVPPDVRQLDKLLLLLDMKYWHPHALATHAHVLPSVLLHPSCPDELLDTFAVLRPWAASLPQYVDPFLRLLPHRDTLKMSAYSALSQWSLYKRTST